MNTNTRKELIKFAEAVEKMAAANCLTMGVQTTSEIMSQCYHLIEALNIDDTITESGIGSGPVSN